MSQSGDDYVFPRGNGETMERSETENNEVDDAARRSFMKKGALASGALALGLGSAGSAAAAPSDTVRVFAYDYRPMVPFDVIDQLNQPTINAIVGHSSVLSDSDEFTGYVIRYQMPQGQPKPGEYAFVLTKGTSLSTGSTLKFDGSVSVFDKEINLLADTVSSP